MALTIHLFVACFALCFEFMRQAQRIRIDGLTGINLSYGLIYGISAATYTWLGSGGVYYYYQDILVALLCFASYFIALFAYKITIRKRPVAPVKSGALLLGMSNNAWRFAYLLAFIVGIISVFIYSANYGGVGVALRNASTIRAGHGEQLLVASGSSLFFKRLIPLVLLLPAYLAWRMAQGGVRASALGFVISFLIASLCLYMLGGRGRIALLLIVTAAMFVLSRVKRGAPLALIAGLALTLLGMDFFINYGKLLFRAAAEGGSWSTIFSSTNYIPFEEFNRYFFHRSFSIQAALGYTRVSDFLYFYDSLSLPLYVIPERLFGFSEPESIAYLNSMLTIGTVGSNIPPGLVAYGYYQLGIMGVVISSALFGLGTALLDRAIKRHHISQSAALPGLVVVLLFWTLYFFQGEPRVFISNLFPFLMVLCAVALCGIARPVHLPVRRHV